MSGNGVASAISFFTHDVYTSTTYFTAGTSSKGYFGYDHLNEAGPASGSIPLESEIFWLITYYYVASASTITFYFYADSTSVGSFAYRTISVSNMGFTLIASHRIFHY